MSNNGSGRRQFLLIAAVFFGPLVAAAWLYYGGESLQPEGRSNHGALLTPIVNLADTDAADELLRLQDGRWLLVKTQVGICGDPCQQLLYKMRQSRKMLGREMDRVERVFLHGDSAPDTVFLEEQHAGLITLSEKDLLQMLEGKRPGYVQPGGLYLVDPLGNLVMYFPPGLDPRAMVDDIKHLLKLSRIG